MIAVVREQNETYEQDLLDMRNDVVFKSFFGNPRNNKLLLSFLNAILHDTISSVALTDPSISIKHPDDKLSVMDIRVVTHTGEQINVEIQLQDHEAFAERMLMYWAKMYTSQDKVGQSYTGLNKAIQIIITNFKWLPKNHFHSMFQLIDPESRTLFTDHMEIHVLELRKLSVAELQETDALEKWLLFLKGNKQLKEALAMESPTMKEAFEEIQRLSEDPATRRIAEYRDFQLRGQLQREIDREKAGLAEGLEIGKKEGLERGKKEGLERGKKEGLELGIAKRDREIVLNMHSQQIAAEMIAKLTGIDLDTVLMVIETNL
ncbi:Rpn family recombination-promoting nuclease/putative transposase [Sporosarcina beigongshangi]|uniref:Rpn family recombination-promoting nuclease/putative transposase n=1 Tax=Sporosarcina beigongshangi TaxID=2782538 RepID=UPI00193A495A|nr:Rpn family recombination-promoting nuclease/putative transposase [Sporosarcina beigongshangi]